MAEESKITYVAAVTTAADIGMGQPWRAGLPLGGIGTGKLDIAPDGSVTNITTNNNIECPICDGAAAMPVRITRGGVPGILWCIATDSGSYVLKADPPEGMPCVGKGSMHFDGRLPVARIAYREIGPVEVNLTAFSPLILGDTSEHYRDSAIPAAAFGFELVNTAAEPQRCRLGFSWQNMAGTTGYYCDDGCTIMDNRGNRSEYREDIRHPGVFFDSANAKADPRAQGNYSLRVEAPAGAAVSWRRWKNPGELWEQFSAFQKLEVEYSWHSGLNAILAVDCELQPGERKTIRYAVGWHFPKLTEEVRQDINYGHMYNNYFADSWQAAGTLLQEWDRLLGAVERWQRLLWEASIPEWMKYKLCDDLFPIVVNSWYTRDGSFTISEAVTNMGAMLGTIDQRNASQAPYLLAFPGLCRAELDMFRSRQVRAGDGGEQGIHWNFERGTPDGSINQVGAVPHDLGREDLHSYSITPDIIWIAGHWPDLNAGYILQWYAYLCWTGDNRDWEGIYASCKSCEQFLRRLDFDGDGIPDLWGAGSSSYDNWSFPYYGLSSYVATMVMAALAAMERMAARKGDAAYVSELAERRAKARESLERTNWNGEYFKNWVHGDFEKWSDGPRAHGRENGSCLVSQLAGQWYASMMGFGYLVDLDMMASAVSAVTKYNHDRVSGSAANEYFPEENRHCGESWPHYVEAYYASLAIYENEKDAGMEQLYKLWKVLNQNDARWDCGLGIAGEQCDRMSGRWYMTNTAGWFALLALAGVWVNLPERELMLAPNLPPLMGKSLRVPLITERMDAVITHDVADGGWKSSLAVERMEGKPMAFDRIRTRSQAAPAEVNVSINGNAAHASWNFDPLNRYVIVECPVVLKAAGDSVSIEIKLQTIG